ncbi:MAG: VTT domain-containing protein, partial [Microbacteriaceae bacterium]|nr:VTT domain-containing protein [Microbacteriaceae bacterium]
MNPFEAFGLWLSGVLAAVLDFVIAIGPLWGAFFATLAIFLETTLFVGIVVPGDTVVMTAATAVHSPGYYLLLLGCVIAGTLGGQSVGFALGRWWGPAIRRSWLGRRLGDATWERAARYVGRRGGIAVFVSRFLPGLHALMP